MRVSSSLALLVAAIASSASASQWSFAKGKLAVSSGPGTGFSSDFDSSSDPVSDEIYLTASSSLEISLDTLLGESASRAHQTVALISSPLLGVDVSFPFVVRPNGRARLSLPYKKFPDVFHDSELSGPLTVKVIVASFADEKRETEVVKKAVNGKAADEDTSETDDDDEEDDDTEEDDEEEEEEEIVHITSSSSEPLVKLVATNIQLAPPSHGFHAELPERHNAKPEIVHTFRPEPYHIVRFSAFCYVAPVVFLSMVLISAWSTFAGANLNQLGTALERAPFAHTSFLASIIAIEYTFYLYFRSASIFRTLATLAALVPVTIFSGSRALREVKQRRLEGVF